MGTTILPLLKSRKYGNKTMVLAVFKWILVAPLLFCWATLPGMTLPIRYCVVLCSIILCCAVLCCVMAFTKYELWTYVVSLMHILGRAGKEAVVILSRGLTECLFHRIEAIVISAGNDRDVWLLYSLEAEEQILRFRNTRPVHALSYSPQLDTAKLGGHTSTFSGSRSHFATLSFLVWLNRSSYSHAWYVESDSLFTGRWNSLFDHFPFAEGPDLVAPLVYNTSSKWVNWKRCVVHEAPCRKLGNSTATTWFVARVSQTLSFTILTALLDFDARGHHEALMVAICNRYNFSIADLRDTGRIGTVNAGGSSFWKHDNHSNMTLSHHRVKSNKLYHPIKCQADRESGMKAIMWSNPRIPMALKLKASKILTTNTNDPDIPKSNRTKRQKAKEYHHHKPLASSVPESIDKALKSIKEQLGIQNTSRSS